MKNKKAFTLVELMIVILVLSILSVTGYIYYGEYKKTARDAVRVSNLSEIENSIKFYYADNSFYPIPDNYLTGNTEDFKDSFGNLWGYGVFGNLLTSILNDVKRTPLDPKTGEYYKYDLMDNKLNYRLKTVLEDTKKDYILENKITNGIVEGPRKNEETGYTFRYSNRWDSWNKKDLNCPHPDVEIVDSSGKIVQTWAGCNSTLGEGLEWGKDLTGKNVEIEDNGYSLYKGFPETVNPVDNISHIMYSGADIRRYFKIITKGTMIDANYDNSFYTIWGKFYNFKQALNGACPNGWHIPDDKEILDLLKYLGCSTTIKYEWMCEGLGQKGFSKKYEYNNVVKLLKIPMSGHYGNGGAHFSDRYLYGGIALNYKAGGATEFYDWYIQTYYFTEKIRFSKNNISGEEKKRAFSLSARCMKD